MSDGTLPLNPATIPGGKVEDVEDLVGAGGAAVIRQRNQVVGSILSEIARVMDVDPAGTEYGLVTRNITERTTIPPTTASVAANLANVPLLAANPLRKAALFQAQNITSGANLYLKLGVVAATNDCSVVLVPGAYYELPTPCWVGQIDGIWDGTVGSVLITEIT